MPTVDPTHYQHQQVALGFKQQPLPIGYGIFTRTIPTTLMRNKIYKTAATAHVYRRQLMWYGASVADKERTERETNALYEVKPVYV